MEQVEILRRFIQRVQAMKSPDHNGEDNFARDFMVSVRSRRRLVSPAAVLPSPRLTSPGRSGLPALCVRCEDRRGARAQPRAPSAGELAGGEVPPAPQPPLFAARAAPAQPARERRERPPGPARSGPATRLRLPIVSPAGRRRLGCGLAFPRPPSPPAPPGRVEASCLACGRPSGLGLAGSEGVEHLLAGPLC